MIYKPEEITDRKGDVCVFRSLKQEDTDEFIRFIEQGTKESPFFPWAPDVSSLNADTACEYILEYENDERKLLLGVFRDGRLIGVNELTSMGEFEKIRHRCATAVGMLKDAKGRGLGKKSTLALIDAARAAGYEQLEATTATTNEVSANNLRGMGFQEYGLIPHKLKNKDGSYVDEIKFVKWL
jgi:L-amino acid N-acyltransferase YncA